MITKEQVIKAQNQWAHAVIEIGTIKEDDVCKQCAIKYFCQQVIDTQTLNQTNVGK